MFVVWIFLLISSLPPFLAINQFSVVDLFLVEGIFIFESTNSACTGRRRQRDLAVAEMTPLDEITADQDSSPGEFVVNVDGTTSALPAISNDRELQRFGRFRGFSTGGRFGGFRRGKGRPGKRPEFYM